MHFNIPLVGFVLIRVTIELVARYHMGIGGSQNRGLVRGLPWDLSYLHSAFTGACSIGSPGLSRNRPGSKDAPPQDIFTGGRRNAGTLAPDTYSTVLCTQGKKTMSRRRGGGGGWRLGVLGGGERICLQTLLGIGAPSHPNNRATTK